MRVDKQEGVHALRFPWSASLTSVCMPVLCLTLIVAGMCEQPGNVRWISITGVDPSLIVRLANKYNLRMLQVRGRGALLRRPQTCRIAVFALL